MSDPARRAKKSGVTYLPFFLPLLLLLLQPCDSGSRKRDYFMQEREAEPATHSPLPALCRIRRRARSERDVAARDSLASLTHIYTYIYYMYAYTRRLSRSSVNYKRDAHFYIYDRGAPATRSYVCGTRTLSRARVHSLKRFLSHTPIYIYIYACERATRIGFLHAREG